MLTWPEMRIFGKPYEFVVNGEHMGPPKNMT